jgi:protease IV
LNPLLARLIFSVWAIEKHHADSQLPLLLNAFKGIAPAGDLIFAREQSLKIGFATRADYTITTNWGLNLKDVPKNTVAIIPINDTIYKYDMECGPAGMKTKSNILQQVDNNPNIIGSVVIIDSPGGEGSAARLMNDAIKSAKKPVVSFIDDLAASAGYYIASAADHVYANNNQALVGSIGTYITIVDYAGYYEQMGLKIKEVYADQSKDKNQDYWQAVEYMQSDGKKGSMEGIKNLVNTFNDQFLSDVKENRGHALKGKETEWNTGKLMFASEAEKIGLIDGVDSLDNIIAKFF